MPFIGEIAALTAAFLWGFGALLFESAGRRVGAFATNLLRLVLACLFLSLTLYLQSGVLFPVHASLENHLWLGISGVIGLAIGDGALFYAIVILGPRLSTLLLSMAPPVTTIIARLFLGEQLGTLAVVGITLTVVSIIWVVSEKHGKEHYRGSKTAGVILGFIAALGQGLGVILAKMGLTGDIDSLSATLLRMIPATLVLWGAAFILRQARPALDAMRDRRTALFILGGALLGPYIGVWLSIVAVKHTQAGIAATLLATVPILIIPIEFVVHRRKPSVRAMIGTILAVTGIAMIFLR
ncbi:DMT family transporter [candidate division KSB1 bacterium]|nr:DMT family transporter [candidate division KSB1 bacterium]RQV99749.1 MAG: DMT family transporter [candidate division KSB1 bacterium]